MFIEGVPDEIKRADLINALRMLGFDPANLASIRFGTRFLEVDVMHQDANGTRSFSDDGTTVAMHSLMVPVSD